MGEDGHIASIFDLKKALVLNKSMILTKEVMKIFLEFRYHIITYLNQRKYF